ncbi:MAG: hypothetical protein RLZ44_419 [Pseudomonadota bacterium]|jgi:diguanylate cyclase (GGDEF)-like protein
MELPHRRRRPWLAGLDSYRGRYLVLSLIMLISFVGSGAVGYWHVSAINEDNLRTIAERGQATALLHDALDQLQKLQTGLGRLLINPPLATPDELITSLQRLTGSLQQLRTSSWVRTQPDLAPLTDTAWHSLERLTALLDELIYLRGDRHRWLPAVARIETSMHPIRQEVEGMLDEMLAELPVLPGDADRLSLQRLLSAMQLQWIKCTSEVRLLISNRFGVFTNDIELGLHSRAENARLYLDAFSDGLQQLQQYDRAGALDLVASEHLSRLQEVVTQWRNDLDFVLDGLTGPQWRPDLALVGEQMEPFIATLQQRLSSLRLELDIESARNITQLTEVSRSLTGFAALLIAAGVLFAGIAYLMFDRMLLWPIRQTTLALKQEARGEEGQLPPQVRTQETRDLIDAFNEMRHQVRERQSHLDHLAHHDTLTGLPNRLLFRDRLEHALQFAERDGLMNAVLFLDLDRFKKVNDTLGHAAGDLLLLAVARRLRQLLRASDTMARLGGDEFAILIERIEQRNDITRLGEKILAALEQPFEIEGRQLHIGTSIGIAITPLDGRDPDTLTRAADTAMYAAKQAGKGCFRFFTTAMSQQANEYIELETALRLAIQRQDFGLHYQPIIDARTRQLHGCEALLRWTRPNAGPVSPAAFVPVLEDMGQLGTVSRWILDQVGARQAHGPQREPLTVSVNLTARLLYDPGFSDYMLGCLRHNRPAARHLIVEITEDSLTQDLDAAERVLRELKSLGVRIALDDFGTGQSSLNHLRRFPFDLVKIDREFVRDIPHDPNDVNLVEAIIKLSHSFGMQVVAEGVESATQERLLQSLGCDYLQGYHISQPLAADQLDTFLAAHADAVQPAIGAQA